MKIIQAECDDARIVDFLEAIKSLGRNVRILSIEKAPKLPSAEKAFEEKAQSIARRIKPRANQPMRLETLEFVLNGRDTWFDQNGDPDPALRNGTGALSKALRPFALLSESPLEILCERRREVVPDGPYKGRYQGTRYEPTRLGKRVKEILQDSGVLRKR